MHFDVFVQGGQTVAEARTGVRINSVQDALDVMATAQYAHQATCLLLQREQLEPAFFDLKTGFAGEVLQKFSNYQMKLIVLGAFAHEPSESLQAFIRESNRGKQVAFLADKEAALAHLRQW